MGRVGENRFTEVSAHQHQPSLSLLRPPSSLLVACVSSAFSGLRGGIHYVTIKDRGQLFYFTARTPSRPRLQGKKSEFGVSLSTTS